MEKCSGNESNIAKWKHLVNYGIDMAQIKVHGL
jgi:hypothetical protein